jgi:hypothetical protein
MADVKRLDAGGDILISGETSGDVQDALDELVARGARVITPLSRVGASWVAACSAPTKEDIDRSQTLDLSRMQALQKLRLRHPQAALCTVDKLGLKRVVSQPTREAVQARLDELVAEGAELVSAPEESFGAWVGVCDTGGRKEYP